MKASGTLREYKIGRCLPTPKCHTAPLSCMCIFAPNHVPFLVLCIMGEEDEEESLSGRQCTAGSVWEVALCVKNSGIWLCYDSHPGTHNMHREHWDLTITGRVPPWCETMFSAHEHSFQIMKVKETAASWASSSFMATRSSSHRPTECFHDSTSLAAPPRGPTISKPRDPLNKTPESEITQESNQY